MLRVTLTCKGAQPEVQEVAGNQLSIGRHNDGPRKNDVILPHSRVSSAHARVIANAEGLTLVDEGSTNGTFVAGVQVKGPVQLLAGQIVEIGPYSLTFKVVDEAPVQVSTDDELPPLDELPLVGGLPPILASDPALEEEATHERDVGLPQVRLSPEAAPEHVFLALREEFGLEAFHAHGPRNPHLMPQVEARARELLDQFSDSDTRFRQKWATWLARELCALGPLDDLLADPSISEILVHGSLWIEAKRLGASERTPVRFSCAEAVRVAVDRLSGARLSPSHPVVDTVLADGVSLHAADRVLAVNGPIVVLTRPAGEAETLVELVASGVLSDEAGRYLRKCVQRGLNLVVCSAGGASSLAVVAALVDAIPPNHRLIVVHRGDMWKAKRAIILHGYDDMARSLQTAQRLRPDWLAVLDVVGAEAAELCAAARRANGGTICTLRARSAVAALEQLQSMVAAKGGYPDPQACWTYVAGCFDVILCVGRGTTDHDGVTSICEVRRTRDAGVVEIFARSRDGAPLAATGVASSHE